MKASSTLGLAEGEIIRATGQGTFKISSQLTLKLGKIQALTLVRRLSKMNNEEENMGQVIDLFTRKPFVPNRVSEAGTRAGEAYNLLRLVSLGKIEKAQEEADTALKGVEWILERKGNFLVPVQTNISE